MTLLKSGKNRSWQKVLKRECNLCWAGAIHLHAYTMKNLGAGFIDKKNIFAKLTYLIIHHEHKCVSWLLAADASELWTIKTSTM